MVVYRLEKCTSVVLKKKFGGYNVGPTDHVLFLSCSIAELEKVMLQTFNPPPPPPRYVLFCMQLILTLCDENRAREPHSL